MRPSGLVMELHVDPWFRGRGIGGLLMEAVEKHFRANGGDWVSLGLFPNNETARLVYDRLGYSPVYVFMGKRLKTR